MDAHSNFAAIIPATLPCLCDAPLLALRRMVLLLLILEIVPGNMRGGINRTNGWRKVLGKLPNTNIVSDVGKNTKANLSFSLFLGQPIRLIQHLRVLESHMGTS